MKTEFCGLQPVIKETSDGTWLVRICEDGLFPCSGRCLSKPIPFGKTFADVSAVVHRFKSGRWSCSYCWAASTRGVCPHVQAVQSMEFEIAQDNADFMNHDWDWDEGLSGRADKDLTDPFDPLELGG